jgi:hypothetical protein
METFPNIKVNRDSEPLLALELKSNSMIISHLTNKAFVTEFLIKSEFYIPE